MKMIRRSFSVATTATQIVQAVLMAMFLSVILAMDVVTSIPARWL